MNNAEIVLIIIGVLLGLAWILGVASAVAHSWAIAVLIGLLFVVLLTSVIFADTNSRFPSAIKWLRKHAVGQKLIVGVFFLFSGLGIVMGVIQLSNKRVQTPASSSSDTENESSPGGNSPSSTVGSNVAVLSKPQPIPFERMGPHEHTNEVSAIVAKLALRSFDNPSEKIAEARRHLDASKGDPAYAKEIKRLQSELTELEKTAHLPSHKYVHLSCEEMVKIWKRDGSSTYYTGYWVYWVVRIRSAHYTIPGFEFQCSSRKSTDPSDGFVDIPIPSIPKTGVKKAASIHFHYLQARENGEVFVVARLGTNHSLRTVVLNDGIISESLPPKRLVWYPSR